MFKENRIHEIMKKKCGIAGDLYLTRKDAEALLRWIKAVEEIQDEQMVHFIELRERLKPFMPKELP